MATVNSSIEPILPCHFLDYESYYDDDIKEELVWITCPSCKDYSSNETSWDMLEKGTRHQCENCQYTWIIE